jgi:hypothetical protein
VRNGNRDGVHHADEIDIRGVDELHGVRFAHGHWQDAGVRDNDVDPAEVGQPRLDRVAQFMALTHVGDPGNDTAPEFLHRSFRLREIIRRGKRIGVRVDLAADVDCDDVGTFPGHRERMGAALTACCTSDESNLAVEPSGHSSSADQGHGPSPALER